MKGNHTFSKSKACPRLYSTKPSTAATTESSEPRGTRRSSPCTLVARYPPTGISLRKRQDPPSSWRTPIVHLHIFHTDAGRIPDTRPLRCRDMALGHRTAKAPAKGLSTRSNTAFRTRCLRFAIRVTPPHAKLASGRWSGVTGQASHPLGSNERFQIRFLHIFFPSQVFLA